MEGVTEHRRARPHTVPLYGLIEHLVRSRPREQGEQVSPGRGVADNHDALEAVRQLAAAIEAPADAGDLPTETAFRMASLLLVIRDYIEPVATPAAGDEQEHLARYLSGVVEGLRRSEGP
jgi:hypothetical protein